jgi:hypothetical protein
MKRKVGLLIMFLACCGATVFAAEMGAAEKIPAARVILLHGMGRSCRSMSKMADRLSDEGYSVVNLDYPSTGADIQTLSSGIVAETVQTCRTKNPETPIHFVTHSLGGILVRHYLQNHSLPPGSRVVMLSPPNRGSEIADLLKDFFLYRWIMGPAGQQLGTSAEALPNRLGPVDVPVGIVTGDHSLEPWFSTRVPGPDDGKVSVASARLPEMTDFLVVHRSHGFIMNGPEVIEQTSHFLKHGMFKREG